MKTKIHNIEDMKENGSKLPEWVVVLMRAYKEYVDALEVEDAE